MRKFIILIVLYNLLSHLSKEMQVYNARANHILVMYTCIVHDYVQICIRYTKKWTKKGEKDLQEPLNIYVHQRMCTSLIKRDTNTITQRARI